ncbi:hypothetical protein NKI38_00990 [Mesorhizobium sp. M0621]|uniref:hypothetical protein n=1 Tax=Mesorhizobium sp. M0621 TaxID=2956974 RepID=UPI00333B2FAD
MKSWNGRLDTPGINGARTMAGAVEGQPMLRALRTPLAVEHGAEVTCPVTIGYHLRTPFWRVLDA